MENIDFKNYAIEILLIVLKKSLDEIQKFKKQEDIYSIEILESQIIPPYEKLYLKIKNMNFEQIDNSELQNLKKYIEKIKQNCKITDELINKNLKLRQNLKENSGAKIIEKFLKYNLNRLYEKKDIIDSKIRKLVKKETELEILFRDTIQECEQLIIIEKLYLIRKDLNKIENIRKKLLKQENILKLRLKNEWFCDIYGIISKKELLNIYKINFEMGQI